MSKKTEYREIAERLLKFLNEKANRNYEPAIPLLTPIMARLKEGATEEDCRCVIAYKVREWKNDEKMCKYLRSTTLFAASKFWNYKGELPYDFTKDSLP